MIFDPAEEFDETTGTVEIAVSAHQLLGACAAEAGRLAAAISRLDGEMADLLQVNDLPSSLLQQIDLARQEATGLAGVLRLIADAPTPDHPVDAQTLTRILLLQAQLARLAQG